MKQILVLSGKGGTGKTTVASAFIEISKARAYADCDVEAPNLHLVNKVMNKKSKPYYGMSKAFIVQEKCIECGLCQTNCRFDSIDFDGKYTINPYACEGCSVCKYVCPVDAIEMRQSINGEITIYRDKNIFSTAELNMGSGNSGKLVTEVKTQLKDNLTDEPLVIIDGSPGIGCPVIASISGVDLVLIVAEPSVSGISDMERIIQTAQKFRVKTAVCVNKYDTNISLSRKIETHILALNIDFLGMIPYDKKVIELINNGEPVTNVEFSVSFAIRDIYRKAIQMIED